MQHSDRAPQLTHLQIATIDRMQIRAWSVYARTEQSRTIVLTVPSWPQQSTQQLYPNVLLSKKAK